MGTKSAEDLEAQAKIRAHLMAYKNARELSEAALARRLGTSQPNMNRQLKGARGMSAGFLLRVRTKLHMSIDQIFDEPPLGQGRGQLLGHRGSKPGQPN